MSPILSHFSLFISSRVSPHSPLPTCLVWFLLSDLQYFWILCVGIVFTYFFRHTDLHRPQLENHSHYYYDCHTQQIFKAGAISCVTEFKLKQKL